MFKIGEFSKLVQVPVPTLRYYDQMGLLKPMQVDRFTSYRYYSASQLPRLNRILALRGLGFSLEEIGAVLDQGLSLDELRGMLRMREAQIHEEIRMMEQQLFEVGIRLHLIEREDMMSDYDVILKRVEPQLVAEVRSILQRYSDVGMLYGEIFTALGANAGEAGISMAIWYDSEHKDRDIDGGAAIALRRPVPEAGRVRVHELPGTMMATTIHHGSYATLNNAYQALMQWMEANHYRISGPSREVYLHCTTPVRQDDPSYVTEIQFPVEKLN